jgi:hypothetical protein
MRFSLDIRLGNDAMQTPADIARVLRELSSKIVHERVMGSTLAPATYCDGRLLDVNGNVVAKWEVEIG